MAYHRALPHVNDRPGLMVMTGFFFATAILAVVLRLYSRRISRLELGADDWFALVSFVLVLGLNGTFLGGLIQGAITGHSVVENGWPVHSDLEVLVQKYKYVFQTIEKIAFGTIKISILFLWKRIFNPSRQFRMFCWIMVGFITAWSISFFFATLFQCGTNWSWNWAPIGFFLTECTNTLDMLTVFTGTDLLTDFIIMLMPVPIIWRLKMPTAKKIGVTSLFMVGIFTIGAGVARMYIYLVTSYDKENNPDFIADFTLFILWSEIEVNVAMVVCCMPVLAPVVGRSRDMLYQRLGKSQSDEYKFSEDMTDGKDISKKHLTSASSEFHSRNDHDTYDAEGPWKGQAHTLCNASRSQPGDIGDIEAPASNREILVRTEIVSGTSATSPPGYVNSGPKGNHDLTLGVGHTGPW
ncbi:uncharacterized protein BDV17DRAFT_292487 [Aspergillus undulatus]|uniref:uncharacterized protein n=1 Tax=Aspergillus undulatus TaxID=1810928 RepID=UPI003CCCB5CB